MEFMLTIILPVFGLIAIGYGVAYFGVLKENTGDGLADYVFVIAIPLLLFRIIATSHLTGAAPWKLWVSYFMAVAVVWVLSIFIIRIVFKRDARTGGIAGVCASFSNLVLIGIPLVSNAYGENGLLPLSLLLSIHILVMSIAVTVSMEWAVLADGGTKARSVKDISQSIAFNLITNPIALGVMAGTLWRLTGLPIGGIAATLLETITATAAPLALISLGLSLRRFGISGNIIPAIVMTMLKLILMPLLVWLLSHYVFHLPPLWVAVVTLCAACPSGANAYLFATRFGTGQALAGNSIVISTLSSVLTLSIITALLSSSL